ncbi:unnamed protein product [Lactuca saligna]|uniref:Uncharacterized protein n=1 Tax=Lactuca saligna TaxID=75948 RepID=A0AA36EJI1_LACSI|nr:unnamed protein product [Lactuca saligna]
MTAKLLSHAPHLFICGIARSGAYNRTLTPFGFQKARRDMTYSFGEEGPAIVQLQKWESSRLQANLTQFHEAFLSPTRELILLLSYHHEGEAISRIVSYPMLSDINSLSWGICEDSNSQHEGALCRELLFVVGDHGLTAHAFYQSTECNSESLEHMPDVDSG